MTEPLTEREALYILSKMYFVDDDLYCNEGIISAVDLYSGYVHAGDYVLMQKSKSFDEVLNDYYTYEKDTKCE